MTRAAVIAGVVASLLAAGSAGAYWSATGTGTGTGTVDTLAAGNAPTVGVSGRTVTVTFAQTTFHGGRLGAFSGGRYTVRRYLSTGGAAVTPGGSCASDVTGSAASLSCTDTTVGFGTWQYTVTPGLSTSWTATESGKSTVATIVPDAPSLTATPASAGRVSLTWPAVGGASGYNVYRRTTGSYNYAAPLNGGSPVSGTSYTDAATANGTAYRYVVRAVGPSANGGTASSVDSNEATATADATAPTAVTMTNPGTPLRGAVALSGTASDAGSGIASVAFQYTTAGGSSWTTACSSATSPYGCSWATTGAADGVYDLRVLATDVAGNTTASATVTSRRVDNTAPAANLTDPGQYLRGSVTINSTASDAGSGLASVKIQGGPAGSGTWTDACVGTTSAPACSIDTTLQPDGVYDLRILAVDVAGNQTAVVVPNRTIDNTKPAGTDVQTANVSGGTAGRPETGDTLTLTFSEAMAPASILAGWTGASINVTVRISLVTPSLLTIWNAGNTAQLPLGSLNLARNYATASAVFTNSTMVRSGSTITVTLGTVALGGLVATNANTGAVAWTTVATPTDLAGNTLTIGTITESGIADRDF